MRWWCGGSADKAHDKAKQRVEHAGIWLDHHQNERAHIAARAVPDRLGQPLDRLVGRGGLCDQMRQVTIGGEISPWSKIASARCEGGCV